MMTRPRVVRPSCHTDGTLRGKSAGDSADHEPSHGSQAVAAAPRCDPRGVHHPLGISCHHPRMVEKAWRPIGIRRWFPTIYRNMAVDRSGVVKILPPSGRSIFAFLIVVG